MVLNKAFYAKNKKMLNTVPRQASDEKPVLQPLPD